MKTNQVSSYVGLQYVQRTTVCTDIVNRQTKCIVYSIARHSVLSERHKGSVDTTKGQFSIKGLR